MMRIEFKNGMSDDTRAIHKYPNVLWTHTADMLNDLLQMMQVNHKIFGEKILQIKDATDEWIIQYFKKSLFSLLDYRAKCESNLFVVESSQWGGITNITPKYIEFTKKQCAEIGNHLLTGIVMIDIYNNQPTINKWDSKIILNYIEKGYDFMTKYRLEKVDNDCQIEFDNEFCNGMLKMLESEIGDG